jgi:hypothetical protein
VNKYRFINIIHNYHLLLINNKPYINDYFGFGVGTGVCFSCAFGVDGTVSLLDSSAFSC